MSEIGRKHLKRDIGDPVENLANAIVLQAVDDLRMNLRSQKNGTDKTAEIKSLEKFFRSRWFGTLTKLDGEMILRKIEEEFK